MPEVAVVNASPLIFLSKAGMIDLLQQAASNVVVPWPVAEEVQQRGQNDVTAQALRNAEWLSVVPSPSIPVRIQFWDLGPGESSVLASALAIPGGIAVIDDGAGRRCAETLGLPLLGTLGLVMIGKKRRLFPAARPIIALLKQHGMYLSESVIDRAMAMIGE
ncbi:MULTISPECIES: DUF3368 domain-containing protein [Desulfonatronum]|uniref:DUF3368 domain-containing protein n=1 Tax=Desulfonatronum TaxID=66848 RepID=UPI0004ABE211|nr:MULTISPECIES: DUF3368 domain-containing protein [Desulfonatronum]PTN34433.1 DUF3368 domain-containing protein [Desulfonatronum sp. SC1]